MERGEGRYATLKTGATGGHVQTISRRKSTLLERTPQVQVQVD